jgi:hypothetical protein
MHEIGFFLDLESGIIVRKRKKRYGLLFGKKIAYFNSYARQTKIED